MKHSCPVCGYDRLTRPPKNYHICPCCGTEFGYDDFDASHTTLRDEWIGRGMPWFSRKTTPPEGWSPVVQLLKAGYGYSMGSARQAKALFVSVKIAAPAAPWTTEPISISPQLGPLQPI